MARVNVYGSMQGDKRTVTIGGRSANDWTRARLNTDNGQEADVAVTLEASVTGNLRAKDRTKRNGGDNRRSVFSVTVPPVKAPDATTVRIYLPGLDELPTDCSVSVGGTSVPIRELWAAWSASKGGAK
jgi:hypothetical protein